MRLRWLLSAVMLLTAVNSTRLFATFNVTIAEYRRSGSTLYGMVECCSGSLRLLQDIISDRTVNCRLPNDEKGVCNNVVKVGVHQSPTQSFTPPTDDPQYKKATKMIDDALDASLREEEVVVTLKSNSQFDLDNGRGFAGVTVTFANLAITQSMADAGFSIIVSVWHDNGQDQLPRDVYAFSIPSSTASLPLTRDQTQGVELTALSIRASGSISVQVDWQCLSPKADPLQLCLLSPTTRPTATTTQPSSTSQTEQRTATARRATTTAPAKFVTNPSSTPLSGNTETKDSSTSDDDNSMTMTFIIIGAAAGLVLIVIIVIIIIRRRPATVPQANGMAMVDNHLYPNPVFAPTMKSEGGHHPPADHYNSLKGGATRPPASDGYAGLQRDYDGSLYNGLSREGRQPRKPTSAEYNGLQRGQPAPQQAYNALQRGGAATESTSRASSRDTYNALQRGVSSNTESVT